MFYFESSDYSQMLISRQQEKKNELRGERLLNRHHEKKSLHGFIGKHMISSDPQIIK